MGREINWKRCIINSSGYFICKDEVTKYVQSLQKRVEELERDKKHAEQNWKIHCDMNVETQKENTELKAKVEETQTESNKRGTYIIQLEAKLKEVEESKNLEFAIQQFTGYREGQYCNDISNLVLSMGLTLVEWEKIKEDCSFLIESDILEIEQLLTNQD